MRMIGPELEPPTLARPDIEYAVYSVLNKEEKGSGPPLLCTYSGHYLEFPDGV